jgi:hypothetical protein
MRIISGSITLLMMVLMLVVGCSTVDADECWPNTSGGFGGGGTIPSGAGVGATTSGDFISPPPKEPLDSGGNPNPNPCMAGNVSYFNPGNFPFTTIVADDGTGKAGGWQETTTSLIFIYGYDIVTCEVRIGMPLRPEKMGKISASTAAVYSSNVANAAAGEVWPTDLPPGIFCIEFKKHMESQFKEQYPQLGAQMLSP